MEFDEKLERPFSRTLDAEYISALGSLGIYDASLDLLPNPPEAPQRWAENPCILLAED